MTQEDQAWQNKRKHLEMIQAIITRMAGNLFFLRGWTITLLTGLLAVSAAKDMENGDIIALALVPLIIFWVLDGYFLSQERQFRELYDRVRKLDEGDIDFSMRTNTNIKKNTWLCSMFAPTLLWFYATLFILVLALLILFYLRG